MPECHYGRIKIGLLTIYGTMKHKEKMTCKNLVQYRYSLMTNGVFNTLAPLQFCGCKIKDIQLYKYLNLSGR